MLDRGHQTQMPGRHRQLVGPRDGPQHRYAGMFTRLAQHLVVASRADAVEDHPRQPHALVEGRKAVQQRGDAVALSAGIHDEDHRSPEHRGHLGRGAVGGTGGGRTDAAVEQTHHALDDRDVGVVAAVPEQGSDQRVTDENRIQVAAGASRRQPVIAGVDEVRPHLERRHSAAGRAQRAHQAGRHRGLAAARGGSGNHDRRGAHHSPACLSWFAALTTRSLSGLCGPHPSDASPSSSRSPDPPHRAAPPVRRGR